MKLYTEYPWLTANRWQPDQSDMFVLMSLILLYGMRCFAQPAALVRPTVSVPRTPSLARVAAATQLHPLAPIHAPTPQLTV